MTAHKPEIEQTACPACAGAMPAHQMSAPLQAAHAAHQPDSERKTPPYRVTHDGAIVDRETGVEIGHVHRNDYGWAAYLASGARSPMHATRRQACDSAWAMRTLSTPGTQGGGQ